MDVSPDQRDFRLDRRGTPALSGQPHGGPVPAGQRRQPPVGKGQAAVSFRTRGNYQAHLPEPFQRLVEPGAPPPRNRPKWASCSQGQSDNRSRARFSAGFSREGSRQVGTSLPAESRTGSDGGLLLLLYDRIFGNQVRRRGGRRLMP